MTYLEWLQLRVEFDRLYPNPSKSSLLVQVLDALLRAEQSRALAEDTDD